MYMVPIGQEQYNNIKTKHRTEYNTTENRNIEQKNLSGMIFYFLYDHC